MPTPSAFLPTDMYDAASELDSKDQLDNAISGIRFQSALPRAIQGIRDLTTQLNPSPLPIVVSPQTSAENIRAQQQGGNPQPMPTLDTAPPTPSTPQTPGTVNATFIDGRTQPQQHMQPGETVGDVTAVSGGGDLEAYARHKAQSLGIDPDTAVRVANTEGGFGSPNTPNQQGAPAYGPYQLYIGGPDNPGLGDAALQQGIDPRNPAHAQRAIDFALEHAARNGWGAFQGAAANGIGEWDGIGQASAGAPQQPAGEAQVTYKDQWGNQFTTPESKFNARPGGNSDVTVVSRTAATNPVASRQTMSQTGQTVSQAAPTDDVAQSALDDPDKWALCGPVAAMIAAGRRGAGWTIQQAKQIATASGLWDANLGMHGLQSEADLLNRMGVSARTGQANEQQLAQDAQNGNTPIVSTNRHYFILTGYDPSTGKFDTSTTGAALRGGSRQLTLDEIANLGGGIQGAAYIDNPSSPQPSVVAPPNAPSAGVPTAAGAAPSSWGGGVPPPPADDTQTTSSWSPDAPASAAPAYSAPAGRGGGGGVMQRIGQPTSGPDTATGDQQPPQSTYNDPTAGGGGTIDRPLPSGTSAEENGGIPQGSGTSAESSGGSPYFPPSQDAVEQQGRSISQQPPQSVSPDSSNPDTSGVGAPAESPLKPVFDMAGRIIGYVHSGLDAAGQALTGGGAADATPSPEEQAQRASVAGRQPGEHLFEPARVVAGTAPPVQAAADSGPRTAWPLQPVQANPGEPDYAPPRPTTPAPGGEPDYAPPAPTFRPAIAGMADEYERIRQIDANAAVWIKQHGGQPKPLLGNVEDPAWRAANPEMAQEYDDLQKNQTLLVGGMVGAGSGHGEEAANIGRRLAGEETPVGRGIREGMGRLLPGGASDAGRVPAPGEMQVGSGFVSDAARGSVQQAPTGTPQWSLPPGVADIRTPISAGLSSGYSPDDIKAFYLNRRWPAEWDANPSMVPPTREGFPPYTKDSAAKIAEQEFTRDLAKEPPSVRAIVNGQPAPGEQLLGSGVVPSSRQPSPPPMGTSASPAQAAINEIRQADLVTPNRMVELIGDRPEYLADVAKNILDQRRKVVNGEMTARDTAKAYYMTLASQGADAIKVSTVESKVPGFKVPEQFWSAERAADGSPLVRPEEAAAAWLFTPKGQAALNDIERGVMNRDAWKEGQLVRTAFGDDRFKTNNVFSERAPVNGRTQFNMDTIQQFTDKFNEIAKQGNPQALLAFSKRLNGISEAKGPFLNHALGFGETPTIDAVEISAWLTGQGDVSRLQGKAAQLKRQIDLQLKDKRVGAALGERIGQQFDAMRQLLPPEATADLPPEVFNHVLHHWIWDRMKGTATTHTGFYDALKNASGLLPDVSPGLRAAGFNAAQGAVLGAAGDQAQADQQGREPSPGERVGAGVVGAGLGIAAGSRGARNAVGHALGALGSGFVSQGPNLEARLAGASRALDEIAPRLEQARIAAERATTGAAVQAANRAYSAVRREYDAAAEAAQSLQQALRDASRSMDASGYGQPIGNLGHTGETAQAADQRVGQIPRTVDDVPRDTSQLLGSGFVPQGPQQNGPQGQAQNLPQNIAARVARGVAQQAQTGLNPLQWTRKFLGQVSYSSLIGPTAGFAKSLGDLGMAVGSHPKEIARAILRGAPAEYGQYVAGGWDSLLHDVGPALIDVIAGRGQYASHGGQSLSSQTQNPVARAAATATEVGGRAFMGVPTAIAGEMAKGAGERLKAAQIATDAVRSGQISQADWGPLTQALTADAKAVRGGAAPRLPMTQDVIQAGEDFSKRQTFQNPIGTTGEVVKRAASLRVAPRVDPTTGKMTFDQPIPLVSNFLAPIFNTPWNMHARMVEGSPLGLAREGANILRGKGTSFDRMYDATTGSALIAGMAGLASVGLMTGNGPTDPQKRQEWISQGAQPYSTLVNGTYVPNKLLYGMWAPAANLAGDVHDAVAYRKSGTDIVSPEVGLDTFARFGAQLRQEAFLQPLADALSAVNPTSSASVGARGAQMASSLIDRFVPYGSTLRAIGTSQDTTERAPDHGQNVPFLSQVAQRAEAGAGIRSAEAPSQDVLGRPIANAQQGIASVVGKFSTPKPDPVIRAFQDANVDIPGAHTQMAIEVPGAGPSGRPLAVTIPLTPEETRDWNRFRGESIQKVLTPDLLSSEKWKNTSPIDRKVALMTKVLEPADKDANTQLQNKIGAAEIRRRVQEAMQMQRAS